MQGAEKRAQTRYNPCVAGKSTLVALLAMGGLACAEVADSPDAGLPRDALGSSLEAGAAMALPCAVTQSVRLVAKPVDMLLLLDRSGSMDTAFASGTRFSAVASLLADVVATYAKHVRFGYQEFPGRQGCEGQATAACCASPPTVGIAADSAAAVVAAIAGASPMEGSTPTAGALHAARAYFETLADGVADRYVLLATDGAPTCTRSGVLATGDALAAPACADALEAVAALVAASVRVIVLGVGPDLAHDASGAAACIDALAHAGGAPASPGSPGYYAANDVDELRLAIEQVFGGVVRPSCVLRFPTKVDDPASIAVFLDGQRIPHASGNGWYMVYAGDLPVVYITGEYCEQIETFQVASIEARYDCSPCVDIAGCKPTP